MRQVAVPRGSFQNVSWSNRSKRSGGSSVWRTSCRTGPETRCRPAAPSDRSNSGASEKPGLMRRMTPAPAPDFEHHGALEDIGVLELQVPAGRDLRHQVGPHILAKVAGRALCSLQRRIEPLVAVLPDQRLGRHDCGTVLPQRLHLRLHAPPQSRQHGIPLHPRTNDRGRSAIAQARPGGMVKAKRERQGAGFRPWPCSGASASPARERAAAGPAFVQVRSASQASGAVRSRSALPSGSRA